MSTAPRTRADAVRNAHRVVEAAAAVLAEKGAEAGIPEIAARAGVGKGTVYRCFPTKAHLVAAVVAGKLRWFADLAEEAAARPDAWAAFTELLRVAAETQATDCTFSEGLARDDALPELAEARAAMNAAIDRLMARAQAEGRMRPGVSSAELRVLFAGTARMLRADGDRDPATWRRYAGLIADAMRA
jgi:AcrR family transcriptional regulator